jgi:3-methylcrotonyl-CoA carboxylase alpha subunit
MWHTILIANRGEIACRIIRTTKRLGIRAVAVYSEVDEGAMHTRLADEALCIGPAAAAQSYLDQARIIDAARKSGAQAVHPGYGFLAENAEFAEACAAAGLVFVGPPPDAMRALGAKDSAKRLMERVGVPIVAGYHGEQQDEPTLRNAAQETGYPVIIKAVGGGGGRGMRVAQSPDVLSAALAEARQEALASFGDDRVIIERYLSDPRHVEVQVFADAHGNVVHLGERDCSLQRRHQKVIEESPAPGIATGTREAMYEAAIRAAKAVGYEGAGTVEFMLDPSAQVFSFLEMNTRLQVEHPVTEMVTGFDLVEWQLRVAAGEPLPVGQDAIAINGHAVEARLYAEDPSNGFLPSGGTLDRLQLPRKTDHIRVDTGVAQGDSVAIEYDPMIAKVIAWGPDRPAALDRLRLALAGTRVVGPETNLGVLSRMLGHNAFASGAVDTGFIDRHIADLIPDPTVLPQGIVALASLGILLERQAEASARTQSSADPFSPWHDLGSWRNNFEPGESLSFEHTSGTTDVTVRRGDAGWELGLPEGQALTRARWDDDGHLVATIDGVESIAIVDRIGPLVRVADATGTWKLTFRDPRIAVEERGKTDGAVATPMPGTVTQVFVANGETVDRGQALLAIEAMKMITTLTSPYPGQVSVSCAAGDRVEQGQVLAVVEQERGG